MKANVSSTTKAHLIRGAFYVLLLLTGTLLGSFRPEAPTTVSNRTLTFAERVSYQRTIEEVYWRHRVWPKENANPKPSLNAVMSQEQLEKKVKDYLGDSQALADYLQRPITGEQLQAEMDRMGRDTKQPEVLHELFDALGNDPFVIAECLARSVLSERLITSFAHEKRDGRLALAEVGANSQTWKITLANATYKLPTISDAATGCTPDTWTATSTTNAPDGRFNHTAVWTGTEMIIWGGLTRSGALKTGGRYTPSTDSWTATSTTDAPSRRDGHTAVWTGSEMIVWGGANSSGFLNTGGRYNPSTDSWTATSTTDAPSRRVGHTAVWTGSEMIVWSGFTFDGDFKYSNTGGRYNPNSDSWTATSTTDAPGGRRGHTAVWTDSEMIVWGGTNGTDYFQTGGRYNPGTDSWTATSTSNAPTGRQFHTGVWTDSEMIVWGGNGIGGPFDTGGRYNPTTDRWTATSTTSAPTGRILHTAVWTGSEMNVWGGCSDNDCLMVSNTGGRYNPGADSWTAASTTNAPTARSAHTGVWTDSEMIVWGGEDASLAPLNSGGRYCAAAPSSTPTPTPTSTPTLTPQPTATPSEAPCATFDSQPACNSTVFTQLNDFIVYITGFVTSLPPPSVFTVNGVPADSVSGGGSTIEFHFIASPVIPGENTMDIPLALSRALTVGEALRVSIAHSPTSHLRLHLHQDLVPHPGLHHHRGLVRLRAHVRDFCWLVAQLESAIRGL